MSTRAAARISTSVQEYVASSAAQAGSRAGSYGLRTASETTGTPEAISSATSVRCGLSPSGTLYVHTSTAA